MQSDRIAAFLDLCETRSFHRTADRLGVTQSTVSARLKALERSLGVALFTRSRAGTELTSAGLRFAPHARALRAEWTAARRAAGGAGDRALTVRLGIQPDLVGNRLADWVARFRAAVPGAALYVELDYSTQMCADLVEGALDFAVLFTPRAHPDLHFAALGELRYRMVSTHATRLSEVDRDRYLQGNFAPAFAMAHRRALPDLEDAAVIMGRSGAVADLLTGLDGTGYLTEDVARSLVAAGALREVADAPVLTQPVHAAMAMRLRAARMQQRLLAITREELQLRRTQLGTGVAAQV